MNQDAKEPAVPDESDGTLLTVEDLTIGLDTGSGYATAVENVSFTVAEGETLGVVGESGSGKSLTAMSILGLLPDNANVSGSIRFRGTELLGQDEKFLRGFRGRHISLIFQDALSALNPVLTIGDQLAEAFQAHETERLSRQAVRARATELLDLVGLPSPGYQLQRHPHELSGGMRQRVLIAIAVANRPDLLIADEPTTALDVTVQAQILEVLRTVQQETGTAIMLITHDLGVVARAADRVLVMYAGTRVESGEVDEIFHATAHPYTRSLLASLPRLDRRVSADSRLFRLPGQMPAITQRPDGCLFLGRCPEGEPLVCGAGRPAMRDLGSDHAAACVHLDEKGAGADV